jgi:protoporphyrinogen oxidase
MTSRTESVIIGAGPAGCAAGVTLVNANRQCLIVDRLDVPGGLSRSIRRDGATFDVGPHRFFTKSEEVQGLWRSFVGDDMVIVNRLTRILYNGRLFNYPLTPINALLGLGIVTSVGALSSYGLRSAKRFLRPKKAESLEDWVADSFGPVLYETFFKHYTEKVWGIPCSEISADWASQRMKGLNLMQAVLNAFAGNTRSRIRTLADRFLYPRQGAGAPYERMIRYITDKGSDYAPFCTVTSIKVDQGGCTVVFSDADGVEHQVACDNVLSSMPITELLRMLFPEPPREILESANALSFRDHFCVNLMVKSRDNVFPDNWIYVHSPGLQSGRIANFANFSPDLRNAVHHLPITVEFFCSPGDKLSRLDSNQKIDLALSELKTIGFLDSSRNVEDAFTVYSPSAYPVTAKGYERRVITVRTFLAGVKRLQTIGRAGLFQYNNQDHSIVTGILAAKNVLGEDIDIWSVNIDAEYLESGHAPELCQHPSS